MCGTVVLQTQAARETCGSRFLVRLSPGSGAKQHSD
jgi:hypothetical protein